MCIGLMAWKYGPAYKVGFDCVLTNYSDYFSGCNLRENRKSYIMGKNIKSVMVGVMSDLDLVKLTDSHSSTHGVAAELCGCNRV
jgi:hypothetical protein